MYLLRIFLWLSCISASASELPSIEKIETFATNYHLNLNIHTQTSNLSGSATITVKNHGTTPTRVIPLRLYRLLSVVDITSEAGKSLNYTQGVVSNIDDSLFQSNYIKLSLSEALQPDQQTTFTVNYSGHIKGYVETGMAYIKDDITPLFSIIRMDAYAYPLITVPDDRVNRASRFWQKLYNYTASIEVDSGLVVANGGILLGVTETDQGRKVYSYKNQKPSWRMDFMVAPYTVTKGHGFKLFTLPGNKYATDYMEKAKQTITLYESWFGQRQSTGEFSFIEIPKGFGAQADVTAIIQDSEGFVEVTRLYHELSHLWDPRSNESYSPRWNEGKATFLEYLTDSRLNKRVSLSSHMTNVLKRAKNQFVKQPKCLTTAFEEYGKAGLNAYSVGALFFALLHHELGEERFNHLLRTFYAAHVKSGASTGDFILALRDLKDPNIDWILSRWVNSHRFTLDILDATNFENFITLSIRSSKI
ncbi:M1 family aminopeptidase [Pseudoalteromonas piscicida]|uniref:M1 family aminopeptidase n=1 Tax=Pseudoalteromonas piscicida TaxID=43662 RepID=UPI003C7E84C8